MLQITVGRGFPDAAQGEGTQEESSALAELMVRNSKSEEAKVARVCQEEKRETERQLTP